jgi:hypothetical protein
MTSITKLVVALTMVSLIAGCSGMSTSQQRMLSGGAIGAGAGAAVGALSGGHTATGAVIGGAAGVVGGVLYDKSKRDHGR